MEETVQAIFILKTAFNLLFDDSDDDEDSEIEANKSILKSDKFAKANEEPQLEEDLAIPRLADKNFKIFFRVNAVVFKLICNELYPFIHKRYGPGRNGLPIEKQVMITLSYLGNMEALRAVSKRFGVSLASSWRAICNVCDALNKMNEQKRIVRWPTAEEAAKTAEFYNSTYKLSGVIGCIDSCHILIRAPSQSANSYLNKMRKHSVLLQAVTNEKMEFLFCHASERGSLDNTTLLVKSGIEAKINAGEFQINNDHHLIGDGSYPLRTWLITPYPSYRKSSNLKDEQIYFNTIQYECLDDIKRTFGLLKGRFRRLNHIDCKNMMSTAKLIAACCILHNICLQNQDFPDEDVKIEIEENDRELYVKNYDENTISQATLKRELLTDLLLEE